MKIEAFRGINNVADQRKLKPGELAAATNVDIGTRGELMTRRGRSVIAAGSAHSVFECPFGVLALIDNDLLLLDSAGTTLRVVYDTLGYTRVWYVLFPDGRVGFSNGLISGIATATATTAWGVPMPEDAGAGAAGETLYQITYVRSTDGLEGAPAYGLPVDMTQALTGLPVMSGYTINVYFAPHGDDMFLAGNTATDTFLHDGAQLGAQHIGRGIGAPPAGTVLIHWNSRILIADGNTVWATRPFEPELCTLISDFIQMPAPVTLLYGTGDGLFVGTTEELYFLAGLVFKDLKAQSIASGRVALGSGVEIPLSYLNEKVRPSGVLQGALCLVDGVVHLIHSGGVVVALTAETYRQPATEVYATARLRDNVMHYLAAPA